MRSMPSAGAARWNCAGSATGATRSPITGPGKTIGTASAADNRLVRVVQAFPSARGNAARCGRDAMTDAVPQPRNADQRRGSLYAFATTILWGVWGAFTGLSRAARVSRDAGLLRLVAHDDPAGALCPCARRLAARSRRAFAHLWHDHRAARRRRPDGAVLCAEDRPALSDISGDLALPGRDHRAVLSFCLRERTNSVGAAGNRARADRASAVRFLARRD